MNKQWIEIFKPLVVALIALVTAATAYLQHTDNSAMDSRMTAIEVEVKNFQPWRSEVNSNMDNFRAVLSDIRSDVSFIRGKMEAGK